MMGAASAYRPSFVCLGGLEARTPPDRGHTQRPDTCFSVSSKEAGLLGKQLTQHGIGKTHHEPGTCYGVRRGCSKNDEGM